MPSGDVGATRHRASGPARAPPGATLEPWQTRGAGHCEERPTSIPGCPTDRCSQGRERWSPGGACRALACPLTTQPLLGEQLPLWLWRWLWGHSPWIPRAGTPKPQHPRRNLGVPAQQRLCGGHILCGIHVAAPGVRYQGGASRGCHQGWVTGGSLGGSCCWGLRPPGAVSAGGGGVVLPGVGSLGGSQEDVLPGRASPGGCRVCDVQPPGGCGGGQGWERTSAGSGVCCSPGREARLLAGCGAAL